jgi:hypothetical protein
MMSIEPKRPAPEPACSGDILLRHGVADTDMGSDRIEDDVEACATGRFAVYAIDNADQGMALLTGSQAGERGGDGRYRGKSVNRRIEERLRAFAEVRCSFAGQQQQGVEKH